MCVAVQMGCPSGVELKVPGVEINPLISLIHWGVVYLILVSNVSILAERGG